MPALHTRLPSGKPMPSQSRASLTTLANRQAQQTQRAKYDRRVQELAGNSNVKVGKDGIPRVVPPAPSPAGPSIHNSRIGAVSTNDGRGRPLGGQSPPIVQGRQFQQLLQGTSPAVSPAPASSSGLLASPGSAAILALGVPAVVMTAYAARRMLNDRVKVYKRDKDVQRRVGLSLNQAEAYGPFHDVHKMA